MAADLFGPATQDALQQFCVDHPNNRRISLAEKERLVGWLTNSAQSCLSHEFSRRNYARKTFTWDKETQQLFTVAKTEGDRSRLVVTCDQIVKTVTLVHQNNNHAGWDATWNDVKASYYGILRADVIFLLKRCRVCADDPRKRPKGQPPTDAQLNGDLASYFLDPNDIAFGYEGQQDTVI
ncbi:hypothetical protein F5Y16DRAFT_414300 [Xylariaceae sp. FL0255]|nr:hypothetical protein F5Y16DRAFT_414300 [Xylariaceae sp. FL0255]